MTLTAETQPINLSGPAGRLEAMITRPTTPHTSAFAVVCHPHPLHQGSMHNKVVTTLARTFYDFACPVLRFNYRGVGESEGNYDEARGETHDALAALAWMQNQYPDAKPWLAGFSFGSFIAANVANQVNTQGLISIAPPVERMPFNKLNISCPWWVVQGQQDEVANPAATRAWLAQTDQIIQHAELADTDHFFHGKLIQLHDLLVEKVTPYLRESA